MQVHDQLVKGGEAVLQVVGLYPRHLPVLRLEAQGVQLAGGLEPSAVLQQRGHPLLAKKRVLDGGDGEEEAGFIAAQGVLRALRVPRGFS